MNSIYKVIWSKAKNCYVVASEIAKSHTKSASGQSVRRSALASFLALSLLCGGLGVAEASVHVNENTGGAYEVLTKQEVTDELNKKVSTEVADLKYAKASDVLTNTANIATNKANITVLQSELDTKADKTYVDTAVAGAVATAGTNADTKLADYAKKADVNNALNGKANKATTLAGYGITDAYTKGEVYNRGEVAAKLNTKANQKDLNQATDRITKNETAINGLTTKTTEISYVAGDGTKISGVTIKDGNIVGNGNSAITGLTNVETGNINGKSLVGTTVATAKDVEDAVKAETDARTVADTALEGKINDEKTAREAKDNAILGRIGKVAEDGNYIKKSDTNSVSKNLKALDAQAKINADAIAAETVARAAKDTELEGKITKNSQDITNLQGDVTTAQGDITNLKAKDTELEGKIQTNANNIQANKDAIDATNKRTSGIEYDNVRDETTIENNVVVDSIGNVTAKGQLTAYDGVYTGTGDITTKGDVNAGSLKVENASKLKGDVTMDKTLSVTGDTKLKKTDVDGTLNVTGESSLKNTKVDGTLTTTGKATFKEAVEMDKGLTVTSGDTTLKGTKVDGALNVTGESSLKNTKVDGTLTTTGKATFKEAVEMDKGLTVTNGATTLKETTVDGKLTAGDADLKNTTVGGTLGVTGETTLNDKLTAKGEATFKENVTMEKNLEVKGELKTDKIAMENKKTDADGTIHNSATTITADGITHIGEVEKSGVITKSQFTHTKEGSETYAKKGNTANWTETSSDVKADGVTTKVEDSKKNRTNTSQAADGIKGYATDKDGNKTYTKVTATENSFQVQDKNGDNKNHQVNTMGSSVTEITNAAGATTKTEQTAENITNIAQSGTITNDAQNIVNNASENITNTAQNGTIKNDAKNIVNNASENITTTANTMNTTVNGQATESYGGLNTTVNGAENHTVNGKQINTVGDGQINNITGNQTTTVTGDISNTAKNITNEANTKLTDKVGTNTRVLDSEGITDTVPGADGKGSTFKQRIDAIMGNVKTDAGESEVTQKGDEITSVVGKGEATNSRVTQKKGSLEAGVTDGINTNASYDVADASAKVLTGGTKVNKLQDNLDSSEKTITNGIYTTSKLQTALDITNTAKDGTITNDAKNIVNNATGDMTNTVGGKLTTTVTGQATENFNGGLDTNVTGTENHTVTGDQNIHVTGNQTTTVTGDISNKAENITNEANTKLTDKVGDHTRVLDSDGITDTVGGSTFKQRIDKIMMESKNVSIKAEETLTNEAKVITNKASEVINNEAVNINNTATGIIKSKASEIQNQADKLISNKVGENTWENMEDGKITTSIKDGAKQNLTQSDAAGTTQSTVDGGKSTVTIQNADGLADAVTDGTNTSVQNQTASAIAAAVKDGAGNENASVANATTSVNTIKSGSKANTVISTADGTSFINSEAAAPVGDGTEVKTTIKGNTITTGKVTMDYAEVMKDIGVRGNANIAGKTTTGSLEVKGESKLTGDVTMESNATVKKDLTVEGNTNLKNTKVDGTLDVTQKATFGDSVSIAKDLSVDGNATIKGDVTAKSYKVGDKTYISAAGINANDQKITNVADGSISEGSKDAVNGGQLYTVKNDLEGKVNKVGANAAAMANLHPMEFDPSSKWNIAAAIGNYGSETAAALGAFYRPNDDVMVNLSTAFGTGENMVGGGVSVRLGKGGNKLSREETNALKAQVADLTARMDALLSVLNPNMSKDFPDVPENHWAYEAVSRLAGNDIVQGYPDGEFHGERTMTRYEMAEIIYNALSRGAEAEKELVEEFKPELQAMAASEKATAEKAEG